MSLPQTNMYLTFHLTFPLFQSLLARSEFIFWENSSTFYLEKTFTSLAIELKLVFRWKSKETVVCFSSGIYLISLSDWSTKLAPLSQRVSSKTKTNHHLNKSIFPRLESVSYSDWFLALFAPVVIGQGNCFGCLTTVIYGNPEERAGHISWLHSGMLSAAVG